MQPAKAKWIPAYFAQCWKLNQNTQIQNASMLSIHTLGEGREGTGIGGRRKRSRRERKEKRGKRHFYWGVIKHVCHFTWIHYCNVIILCGHKSCSTPSFYINLLLLKGDFLGHSFIHSLFTYWVPVMTWLYSLLFKIFPFLFILCRYSPSLECWEPEIHFQIEMAQKWIDEVS